MARVARLVAPWLALALACCTDRGDEVSALATASAHASSVVTAAPAPAPAPPSASGPPSASAAPVAAPSVSALPPPRTSRAPIRDCEPEDDDESGFSCCSQESFDAVQRMIKDRSIADCKRIDALPYLAACPTFFARGFHTSIEACFEGAMNRELDRRLVPLKRVDAREFHREMALQKAFNEALRETCDDVLMKEQSTGDFRGAFRCATFLLELRTKQATAVAGAGLEITHAPATSVRRARRFAPFAKELCAIPVWSGGAAPSSCDDRVMGELEDTLAAAAKF